MKFEIPIVLPGMNEMIAVAKQRGINNAPRWGQFKRAWTDVCYTACCHLKAPTPPVFLRIHWIEKDRRRDLDNVAAAKKFIFDGMVAAGLLPGDGWRWISGWEEEFSVDPKNAGVVVEIEEPG